MNMATHSRAHSPSPGLCLVNKKDITRGKILGGGGFGAVYVAKHVNWGKVAVKEFKGISLTEDIQREADKMLRVLSSPYLVRIMGLIKHHGSQLDIVMEYCEYGSLKDFQKKYMKCDCWARKVKMVQDIAYGMNYLHTLKPLIIHRDLKLENVFVGSGFDAKIGDLGLAVSTKTSLKRAGIGGTISHIPPEAMNPKAPEPDEFFDIYTFGITIYELVSEKDPWPQIAKFGMEMIALWVTQGHRPDLKAIPSETPKELIDLIQRCWVPQRKERPRFKVILESVTRLFESKYEHGLRRADRAISEQIDLVQEASDVTAKGSISTGSQGSDRPKGKDSGLGQSDDGKKGLKGVVFHKKKEQPKSKEMRWQYKHSIDTGDWFDACQMITSNHLATCMTESGCVKVYDVTLSTSHQLQYTVSLKDWKGKGIYGVAVSESLPDSMLVICEEKPHVYECPCHEATKVIKKYKIESDVKDPWCIVANANTAVIRPSGYSILVCRLPGFTKQSCVQIDFWPYDLGISQDYLLVMGEKVIVVKALSDVRRDVCRIKLPDGCSEFKSVCYENNAKKIYAACWHSRKKVSVYRYTWDGVGNPKYSNPTCIIEGLGNVENRCLSVTSDGLLAVGQLCDKKVKIYKLQ